MKWYAAHAIMYIKFLDGNQDKYPIWENIILIGADSAEEALIKAKERAKQDEYSKELTWESRPAVWVFAGIRKLISCVDSESQPGDGTEITYSQMEVDSEKSLSRLVQGESVTVLYEE